MCSLEGFPCGQKKLVECTGNIIKLCILFEPLPDEIIKLTFVPRETQKYNISA